MPTHAIVLEQREAALLIYGCLWAMPAEDMYDRPGDLPLAVCILTNLLCDRPADLPRLRRMLLASGYPFPFNAIQSL